MKKNRKGNTTLKVEEQKIEKVKQLFFKIHSGYFFANEEVDFNE